MHTSKAQEIFAQILRSLKISFMAEHEEFAPYCLDFYLPEWHLCVEIDGPQHTPQANRRRDDALMTLGIPTLRLGLMTTIAARQEAVLQLVEFIEQHAETTRERLRLWSQFKIS